MEGDKKTLVLIDFDGTITKSDSFYSFILFCVGKRRAAMGAFANLAVLLGYKLKLLSNSRAKEQIFSYFFKNERYAAFQEKCAGFARTVIPGLLTPGAVAALAFHRDRRHRIVVVTASVENYVKPWAAANRYECIATQTETANGLMTGRFSTPNCHGEEKVNRIKAWLQLSDYQEIYAYGNEESDRPMLNLATKPLLVKW